MAAFKSLDIVGRTLKRHKELKRIKQPWLDQYQLLGEYINTLKQDFQQTHEAGEFLNRELFNSKGQKAAKVAASSIVSKIWPQSVKRMRFNPPKQLKETKQVKEYYQTITERQMFAMDNYKSGFQTALLECAHDMVVYGTSGIEIESDSETKVIYRPWGVKHMSIGEGKNGMVDTIYLEMKKPVHKLVKTYGIDKVSEKVRKAFQEGDFDKEQKILIAIEPRITQVNTKGNRGLPFQSVHLEIDTKHLLKESGFPELSIKVGRLFKILKERYGRSMGMDALPDILEANSVREAIIVAVEKTLDPPLAVLDDGKLGGGEIDTSAGALNVFNITGRAGERSPVEPLFTVGDINFAVRHLEQLEESISEHFAIDRLLDFNNETQMTFGEARIRDRLRNDSLGSILGRFISEIISPTVERTFNVLLEQGEFGKPAAQAEPGDLIIPEEVVELMVAGEDVYEIEYFTPAMRIMQAEELEGLASVVEMSGAVGNLDPNALLAVDFRKLLSLFTERTSSPSDIRRAEGEIEEILEQQAAAAQAQAEQEQMQAMSEAARNVGQSGLVPTQQGNEEAA